MAASWVVCESSLAASALASCGTPAPTIKQFKKDVGKGSARISTDEKTALSQMMLFYLAPSRSVWESSELYKGQNYNPKLQPEEFAEFTIDEGGQMPYFRRIPKRGFTNAAFKTEFWIVNLGDIVAHADFAKGGEVTAEKLVAAGLIRDTVTPLKILGDLGEAKSLSVKLNIKAARVSDKARKLVEGAGGSVEESGSRRDRVRGIDRESEDRTPKNLTKKLKRSKPRTELGGGGTKKKKK